MSFVLQTWTMQTLKANDELKGPMAGAAQSAVRLEQGLTRCPDPHIDLSAQSLLTVLSTVCMPGLEVAGRHVQHPQHAEHAGAAPLLPRTHDAAEHLLRNLLLFA